MKITRNMLAGLVVAGSLAGATIALAQSDEDKAIAAAVKARQSQMTLYAFNLGLLGDMAKGAIDYDADAASKAAANLAALTATDQSRLWPQGSDEMSMDGTRAMPKIWENIPDVVTKSATLAEAAAAMAQVAGTSKEAMAGAMGALGGACGSCHKAYRAPKT